MKHINSIFACLFVLLFSSCIKEKYPIKYTDNTARPIAEFLKGGADAASASIKSFAASYNESFLEFDLTDIGYDLRNTLGGDATITVAKDNSLIDAYNTANSTAYEALPETAGDLVATSYSFSDAKKMGKIRIKVKSSELAGFSYALALKITATSKGEVSQLRSVYITEVKVKNAYEADYLTNGLRTSHGGPSTTDPITGTFPWVDYIKTLSTVDNTTCELETADGVDLMLLTVNPDNSVTISDSPNGSFATSNEGPCSYDPATQTFTLNYKYFNSAGRIRIMSETLVRQ